MMDLLPNGGPPLQHTWEDTSQTMPGRDHFGRKQARDSLIAPESVAKTNGN